MRLLHTSDWHLGASEGEHDLGEDQRFFLNAIYDIVRREQVDAVLLAGDIFDHSVAAAAAIALYNSAMTELCHGQKIPVLMIAGNHDSAERLSSCADLLEQSGLYIAGAAQCPPKSVELGDSQIFLLPWVTEAKVRSLYPDAGIQSLTDAYQVLGDAMRAQFLPEKRHILVAHAFLTDSETSTSDRAAEIGFATQVSAQVFEGFDYVALGHLHKPQDVKENIRYSGTPMPYSFGREEEQTKSVTIVDTADMSRKIVPMPLLHRRKTLKGTYEELMHPTCSEEERNGYVRLNVTDTAVGLELISKLREVYPHPLVIAGRTYDGEESTITLTMEEFEQMEQDPMAVFRSFCREEIGQEATPHFLELFEKAVSQSMEGAE